MKATVFSCYMKNVHEDVVRFQAECVHRFLPDDWDFYQVPFNTTHPHALQACVEQNNSEITIFLDIDCIPLSYQSFKYLLDKRWGVEHGSLMGAAQRANHLINGGHIYVGPFCMAFKNSTYEEIGKPSFVETYKGDVGEELTYAWERAKKPVYFLWPSDVEKPMWSLIDNVVTFGQGTTYEDLFYHSFSIREGQRTVAFIERCKKVLDIDNTGMREKEEALQ